MCVFSFHPVKHITTGEGGAVTTNYEAYYRKLLAFRSHGITKENLINASPGGWYYEMQALGYNYRMTDFQAALGLSQINRLKEFIKIRRFITHIYNLEFNNNQYFDTQLITEQSESAYHLYPILLKESYKNKKREIFEELRNNGLGVQVHYIPVYFHPYYKELGYKLGICPNAESFYQKEISIPIYPSMTNEQVSLVIKTILGVLNSCIKDSKQPINKTKQKHAKKE
jgi:dTDP-4-amino-4,6-dideoxygalactose transaminase